MIYEDILSFWLAYLLWEFLPILSNNDFLKLSNFQLISIYFLKEIFFIFILFFIRRRLFFKSHKSSQILEKLSLLLVFSFYIIDISLLEFKNFFYQYYFSSIVALFWFLHYYLLSRIIILPISLDYIRFFSGLIIPFLILIFIDEIFSYFNIFFPGQFLLLLLIVLSMSPYIIIKIWPVKKLSEGILRIYLDLFLKSCKISFKDYIIIPSFGSKVYTAGVLGFIPPFRYLFFSASLLDILNIEEILGVVAHEIGHIKKKHGFLLLIILTTFPILLINSIYIFLLMLSQFFTTTEDFIEFLKSQNVIYLEIGLSILLITISILFFRFIFAFFLRNLEREADLFALKLIGRAEPLISALYKIGEVTGQLFHRSWHHFGLWERINYLKLAETDPTIIKSHSQKIRLLLLLWLICNFLSLLCFLHLEGVSLKEFLHFLFG